MKLIPYSPNSASENVNADTPWLLASDCLPDTDRDVLVAFRGEIPFGGLSLGIAYSTRDSTRVNWWIDGHRLTAPVTHWMDLPRPPEVPPTPPPAVSVKAGAA